MIGSPSTDRNWIMRKHSTQIGHIFENVPNLCRKCMGVNLMYPICVECLHIPMCKLSTQIGYIFDWKWFWHFFKLSPDLCRMLTTQIGYILKSHCSTYHSSNFYVPNLCRMLVVSILHRLGTFWRVIVPPILAPTFMYPICVECL